MNTANINDRIGLSSFTDTAVVKYNASDELPSYDAEASAVQMGAFYEKNGEIFGNIAHLQYYILFHILSTCFLYWFTPHLLKSFSKAGICKSFRHKESVIHKSGFLRIMNHAPDLH